MGLRACFRFILVVALSLCLAPAASAQSPTDFSFPTVWPQATSVASERPAPAHSRQGIEFELLSQLGGTVRAIALRGSRAYVGVGPRLVILDVSDPIHPAAVGRTVPLSGPVASVALSDTHAYVVTGQNGGMHTVDISDNTAPRVVSFVRGSFEDVALAGGYAYVVDGWSNLYILDLTDPASPTQVGVHRSAGNLTSVAAAGNYVYVAAYYSGLRIVDVSDPLHPMEAGYYDTPDIARGVAVAGDWAYVADDSSGLRAIRVSDPAHPSEAGFYDTPGTATDVVVDGAYAYVADGSSGLRVISVSDPSHLASVGSRDTPWNASGLAVEGGYAYVADNEGGLRVLDISDSAHLTESAIYNPYGWGAVRRIAISGDYAYIAADSGGLRILDIENPQTPAEVGSWSGNTLDVAVVGNYAYTLHWPNRLRVFNVTNRARPTEVGSFDVAGRAQAVVVVGKYAYVAAGNAGLRILDVSNPTHLVEVGFYETPGDALGLVVAGEYAYVAAGTAGLCIVRISDPTHPLGVGVCDTPGDGLDVTIAGGIAYVTDGARGLRVINISDPQHPSEVGSFQGCYTAGIALAGSYAYVADDGCGLIVADVADPSRPVWVGVYATPGSASCVASVGGLPYCSGSGLVVLQILRDKVITTIPLTGGTLSSTSGDTEVIFPSGAFTATVDVTYRQLWADHDLGTLAGMGRTFDLSAVYSDSGLPASLGWEMCYRVNASYTAAERGSISESSLGLYWWNAWDGSWGKSGSMVDPAVRKITRLACYVPGQLAILGETQRLFLPVMRKR